MTGAKIFFKNAKCKHGHRAPMSKIAWSDLTKHCNVLKIHDTYHYPKCMCQKQITFTPKQFQLEGGSIKSKLKAIFKGTKTTWDKFLKPALNIASPYIGMAVSAKTKNPKVGQAMANNL